MNAAIGAAIIAVMVAVGFICVDEATWRAWGPLWLVGGGGAIGVGIALILEPCNIRT